MASKKIKEARERKLKEACAGLRKRMREARNADGAGFNNAKEQKGAMASARTAGRLDDY